MLSLVFAVALLQAAPEPAPADAPAPAKSSTLAVTQANGLPKEDYELVAWCHGALAGQLELDPIAKADMEKIEGKAKVEARAKGDAELAAERRQYLKDYEHALAAAEAASPTAIHNKGVMAEEQGYKLWTATRNKEPIWRMLDWGIWDPNDAGCGDAAKRLYNKSKLFAMALKNSEDAPAKDEPPPPVEAVATPTSDVLGGRLAGTLGGDKPAGFGSATTLPTAPPAPEPVVTTEAAAAPPAPASETAEAKTDPAPVAEASPEPVKKKPAAKIATRTAKAKPKAKSAEQIRAELEKAPPAEAAPATDKPADPVDPPKLRGRE